MGISQYEFSEGYHKWKLPNGALHRTNGPAAIFQNIPMYFWFYRGRLHREDGPAIQDGEINQYYLNGKNYSFKEYYDKQRNTKHANNIISNILAQNYYSIEDYINGI